MDGIPGTKEQRRLSIGLACSHELALFLRLDAQRVALLSRHFGLFPCVLSRKACTHARNGSRMSGIKQEMGWDQMALDWIGLVFSLLDTTTDRTTDTTARFANNKSNKSNKQTNKIYKTTPFPFQAV